MKIALAALPCQTGNISYNLDQIEKACRKTDARLVVFGEAYLQGFESMSFHPDDDVLTAVSVQDSAFLRLYEISLSCDKEILTGFFEKDHGCFYSSCAWIKKGKLKYLYRRVSSSWKEPDAPFQYDEGKKVKYFSFHGVRSAVALCGDLWERPEAFYGADMLFWPVWRSFSDGGWEDEKADYARQTSFAQTAFMVNPSCGSSTPPAAIVFRSGKIVKELVNREGILEVEIDNLQQGN